MLIDLVEMFIDMMKKKCIIIKLQVMDFPHNNAYNLYKMQKEGKPVFLE